MEESINQLIEISGKKAVLLEEMLKVTREQTNVIEKDDMEKLGKLIDEKQRIIEAVNILDDSFEDNFNRLKQVLGLNTHADILKSSNQHLNGLKQEIGGIIALIKEIKDIENKNHEKVSAKKNQIAKKLKEVSKGKIANKMYSGNPLVPPNPAFIDKKK